MSMAQDPAGAPPLVERVKGLLVSPKAEWPRIDAEPATVKGLYLGYVVILAAIPVLAQLIGGQLFGYGAFGFRVHPPLIPSVIQAVLFYLVNLAWVYVFARIVEALAPNFGAVKDRMQAFKVSAYMATPVWVAGVLQLLLGLGLLGGLVGLILLAAFVYSVYQLYLGLQAVMKPAADKLVGYVATAMLVGVGAGLILGLVLGVLGSLTGGGGFAGMRGGHLTGARGEVHGKLRLPGGGEVDMDRLQAASKQMEAQAAAARNGTAPPVRAVAADMLSDMLPLNVAGYSRGDVSSSSAGAAGYQTAQAQADYSKGERRFTLSVVDMGGAAAFANLAGAIDVSRTEKNGTRYQKLGKVDGRTTQEAYDSETKDGSYSVVVGERFTVAASGTVDNVEDLKAAVRSVDFGKLEAMARK